MSSTTDSSGSRLLPDPSAFVSRHPIGAVVAVAVVFAGGAGIVTFGYMTVLGRMELVPRIDAIAVMGVIAGLLLASGVIVVYIRQSTALDEGLGTLRQQRILRSEELETVRKQTEVLEDGMNELAAQQRALYTPALEIGRLRATDRSGSTDVLRFDVANSALGEAVNLTVHSEVELIGTPDGYSVSPESAMCPFIRTDRWQRVPAREELDFETNVLVNVSEPNGTHAVTCQFSDAMRVFYEDGVEAIELSFEFAYEDVFGDEHTEQIRLSKTDITSETTLSDVLRSDAPMSDEESVNTDFEDREPPRITSD